MRDSNARFAPRNDHCQEREKLAPKLSKRLEDLAQTALFCACSKISFERVISRPIEIALRHSFVLICYPFFPCSYIYTLDMRILGLVLVLLLLGGCSFLHQYPPSCHFTYSPGSGPAPLTVTLDGRGSFDPDGYITSYSWSYGDGYTGSASYVQHTYSAPGNYLVKLTVRDDDGNRTTASATIIVTVRQYSFTDSSKPVYPRTGDAARQFVSDVRPPNWTYSSNTNVSYPDVSYAALRGDCDDFAVMLAFFLQEHWGYDTFIAWLSPKPGSSLDSCHATCFIRHAQITIDLPGTYSCSSIPVVDHPNGYRYYPIDWTPCPGWTWDDFYMIHQEVQDAFSGDMKDTYHFEWYDFLVIDLYQPLSENEIQDQIN